MLKPFFFRILFISWLVFITFSSLFSFTGSIRAPRLNIPHVDKLVHFVFYFVLVALAVKASMEMWRARLKFKKALWYSLFFAVAYGILIELLQYGFTENRHGDFFDVLANSLGALLGMYVVKHLISRGWSVK